MSQPYLLPPARVTTFLIVACLATPVIIALPTSAHGTSFATTMPTASATSLPPPIAQSAAPHAYGVAISNTTTFSAPNASLPPATAASPARPMEGPASQHLYGPWTPPAATGGQGAAWESADESVPELLVRCPEPADGPRVVETGGEVIVYGCPIRIYDRGYGFGSPRVAIDPNDSNRTAFAALHGAPAADSEGGSVRARIDQTHSTFTTDDGGLEWTDQPTGPNQPGRGYLGEDLAITYGNDGEIHVAYVWTPGNTLKAQHEDGGEEIGDIIGVYRTNASHGGGVSMAYHFGDTLWPRDDDHRVDGLGITTVTVRDHGVTDAENDSTSREHTVVVWRERSADTSIDADTNTSTWLEAAWAPVGDAGLWTRTTPEQTIGPCDHVSAPVTYGDDVYVACVRPPAVGHERAEPEVDGPDAEANATDRTQAAQAAEAADVTDVTIYALDITTGNWTKHGTARIAAGTPHLTITPDGYTMLLTSRLDSPLEPRVEVTFGWYADHFDTNVRSVGAALHRLAGTDRLMSADITAVAITPTTKTAYLVYKQRLASPETDAGAGPAIGQVGQPREYTKILVAFDQCEFPVAASRVQLGLGLDPVNAGYYAEHPGMYDDIHDGLAVVWTPSGSEDVRFAINDYGAIQYGDIVGSSAEGFCGVLPPAVFQATTATPQGMGLAEPAHAGLGAVLGLMSITMAGYLLTVKRKAALAASVGA